MTSYYSTAESVTQGYPDKLCDQIADAILDAVLEQDPEARVDCQVAATTGLVLVAGEVASDAYVIVPEVVRQVINDTGFNRAKLGFDADTCGVAVSVAFLGRDIAQGYYASPDKLPKDTWERFADTIGATDQVTVTGFACDETPELIPLPIALAHRLCRQLDLARREALIPFLGPDGRSQVTMEYEDGQPRRVDSVVITTQHAPLDHMERLETGVLEKVIRAAIPGDLLDERTRYFINPSGRLVIGGPFREPGLSGRQGIVDGYGGLIGACGPTFVGRDPMRIERCAAYMARHVAKNVVAAGLACRFRIEITYAPGVARPVAVTIDASGTEKVPLARIQDLINRHFDLRPAPMIEHLKLRRPIYRATATYGAFGRMDIDAPWEETDHAERLRSEARWKTPHELLGIAPAEPHGPLGMRPAAGTPHEPPLYAEGPRPEGSPSGSAYTTVCPPRGLLPGPDTGSTGLHGTGGEQPECPDLRDADLSGRDLQGKDLRGADLRGSSLERANLSGADLTGADLRGCNLVGANLREANFSSARLVSADLSQADLAHARLMGADLTDATLFETDLDAADLTDARLQNADLRKSNLRRACLRSADLTGADLTEAIFFEVDYSNALLGIDQLCATVPPEQAVRCPVCLKKGVITDVTLYDEDHVALVDFGPDGNLPGVWPCGHFAKEAWRFFWPNFEGSGNDWLSCIDLDGADVLDNLPASFPDHLVAGQSHYVFTFGPHHEIEECFYSHFNIVTLDTGDRWGSKWILPFVDGDERDALRQGWRDIARLFEALRNPFEPETEGWEAFETIRGRLMATARAAVQGLE